MNKSELINKIKDLYDRLLDHEYDFWYNSRTITCWDESFRRKQWDKLYAEKQELINQIENSF